MSAIEYLAFDWPNGKVNRLISWLIMQENEEFCVFFTVQKAPGYIKTYIMDIIAEPLSSAWLVNESRDYIATVEQRKLCMWSQLFIIIILHKRLQGEHTCTE